MQTPCEHHYGNQKVSNFTSPFHVLPTASSKSLRLVKSSRSPSHLLFPETPAELINQLINWSLTSLMSWLTYLRCNCFFLRTWSERTGSLRKKTWMKLFLSQRMMWKTCRSTNLPSTLPHTSRARPLTLTCAARSNSRYCFTRTKEISWYVTFDLWHSNAL